MGFNSAFKGLMWETQFHTRRKLSQSTVTLYPTLSVSKNDACLREEF